MSSIQRAMEPERGQEEVAQNETVRVAAGEAQLAQSGPLNRHLVR